MNVKHILKDHQADLRQVYQRIIFLALIVHIVYAITFSIFTMPILVYYHIASILFYVIMSYCVRKNYFRLAVSAVHIEVCICVLINSLLCGWNAGFALYLIAIATLVYFCPFNHIFIPYLFSLAEVALFFILKFWIIPDFAISTVPPNSQLNFLYFLNAISAFSIILYAALISNVSAATTKKVLLNDNKNLKNIAHYDQLTNLVTRRYLLDKIDNIDLQNQKVIVVMADIDDFKLINDQYGHPCGDYILQVLGALFKKHLSNNVDVCRWGGEEFVIIFNNINKQEALEQIKNICKIVREHHFVYEQQGIKISMTFGISYSEESTTFEKLLEIADKRLYIGKNTGKNVVINHD